MKKWMLLGVLYGLVFGRMSFAFAQEIVFEDINPDQSNNPFFIRASGGRVNGLASVPGNNQVFYAASEWGGVYMTNDGGREWKRLDGHLPAATWDVEINPADPNIVYATSFYDGRVESLSGINVSQDGGATWKNPTTATPPRKFNCERVRRKEPNALGISVDPRDPNNVYIGYTCGLAISRNGGRTWRFVDPGQSVSSTDFAETIVDVVAHRDEQGNEVIDVCGNDGHFRSTVSKDGGRTWKAGTGLPAGLCSIAVSPDESYVLLAVVGTTIYQTVDGEHWIQNINNPSPMGRIPFVATNQRSNDADRDIFDLWFGDIHLHRFQCTTPAVRKPGGAPRCPADETSGAVTTGAHVDAGDIAFDTRSANDACPTMFSSDGGVYYNTLRSSPGCHSPIWTQPDVTPHALWLWSLVGAHQEGPTKEGLYFGTQDNAMFGTTGGGVVKPDWNNADCCDIFDLAATPNDVIRIIGVPQQLSRFDPELIAVQLEIYPNGAGQGLSGGLIGFLFPETIGQWGEQRFVLVTADQNGDGGLFITSNNGSTWTELGHETEPPTGGAFMPFMCAIQVSFDPHSHEPVFYAQVGLCGTNNLDQLWRFVGTDPNGRWEQISLPNQVKGSGISIFAVDRSNSHRLYASLITPGKNPRIIRSGDGGVTWQRDRELDALMQGNGAFRYQTRFLGGPTNFTTFFGYPQPSLFAFDPSDPNLILAGGHDSGVFLSRNGGSHWRLVTDPFDPVASGVPHLTQPRYAYFDHDPHDGVHVYIGTVGRGVWRMRIP